MFCNVAECSTLLSRYRERIYVMKSPLFGSQKENPSPKRQGHSYSLLISFSIFLFHARETYAASIKRDDVLLFN